MYEGVYDGGEHSPKLLTCSHTVCLHCLTQIVESTFNRSRNQQQQTQNERDIPSSFSCPICRYWICDFILWKIIKQYFFFSFHFLLVIQRSDSSSQRWSLCITPILPSQSVVGFDDTQKKRNYTEMRSPFLTRTLILRNLWCRLLFSLF